jgi:hypothetical protein
MFAAVSGSEEVVTYLLSLNVDVNKQRPLVCVYLCLVVSHLQHWSLAMASTGEQTGNTALHNACRNQHIKIAEKLIRHGASKTLQNKVSRLLVIGVWLC